MKNLLLSLFLLAALPPLTAQSLQSSSKTGLPAFRIRQTNGNTLSVADLSKDRPVLIVYFDPGCDHCDLFIHDLLLHIKAFTGIQVVLITYVPVQQLKSFVSRLSLDKFPEIKVGTEGTAFIVRYHYDVVQFPYLALHDKTGRLFANFEAEVPGAGEVADMFK